MPNKIIIAGGTGALGTLLRDAYAAQGWEVGILGRSSPRELRGAKLVHWDGCTLGGWADALEGATAVVNLAGQPIDVRFTTKNKRKIRESRVSSTSVIGEAIGRCRIPPRVWINAGGISIFEPSPRLVTESSQPAGTDFLAAVSQQWEAAFHGVDTPSTRKVQLRIGSVLLTRGGMLAPLVRLAKLGLGGTIGRGDQYVSWVHQHDFVKLIGWLIQHENIAGTIHACSPHPVTNSDFMSAVRQACGVRFGLPAPVWLARAGARLIGKEPDLVLSGRQVVSQVLAEEGFEFDFPELHAALRNLIL